MNIQDQRLANSHIVRTKVCKECWGTLVVKHIDGQEVVVCAADSIHQGFISQTQAASMKRQQQSQAAEVKRNYPKFYPSFQETARESTDSLYL